MKKRRRGFIAVVFFLTTFLFLLPNSINAQSRKFHKERTKVRRERVVKHKVVYKEVIVKKNHYFYREGYFYNKGPKGYIKVVAPIGARITLLPHGYKIVRVHRVKYYVFGGVYYRFYPREKVYVVVKTPL